MKKRIVLTTILLTLLAVNGFANTTPEIFIRLHNQQIYYSGQDISIQVELRNTDIDPIAFKLADSRVHNLKLDVRTLSNDPLEECDQCIKEFISSQPVYYTEITLKAGEQFSFIIKLKDFVSIEQSGKYFIKAWFYNQFRSEEINPSGSNVIEIEIAPPEQTEEELKSVVPVKSMRLEPEPIYPDEVIKYILQARTKAQNIKKSANVELEWDKYFLYFDLEELLLKSGEERRGYLALSETARANKIKEYRKWLIEGKKDKDLLLIPTKYEIIKTSFTEKTAVVVVYKEFDNGRFIDRKQYSYYLRKMDNIWTIYDFSIVNMMESPSR